MTNKTNHIRPNFGNRGGANVRKRDGGSVRMYDKHSLRGNGFAKGHSLSCPLSQDGSICGIMI